MKKHPEAKYFIMAGIYAFIITPILIGQILLPVYSLVGNAGEIDNRSVASQDLVDKTLNRSSGLIMPVIVSAIVVSVALVVAGIVVGEKRSKARSQTGSTFQAHK